MGGRDKGISDDAHWQGTVDENLKEIKDSVSGIGERIAKIDRIAAEYEIWITVLESNVDGKEMA